MANGCWMRLSEACKAESSPHSPICERCWKESTNGKKEAIKKEYNAQAVQPYCKMVGCWTQVQVINAHRGYCRSQLDDGFCKHLYYCDASNNCDASTASTASTASSTRQATTEVAALHRGRGPSRVRVQAAPTSSPQDRSGRSRTPGRTSSTITVTNAEMTALLSQVRIIKSKAEMVEATILALLNRSSESAYPLLE